MSWQCLAPARAGRVLLRRDDVDDATSATGSELNRTSGESEQGVVATSSNVATGVEVGTALADYDLAGVDDLAAKTLHADAVSWSHDHCAWMTRPSYVPWLVLTSQQRCR